MQLSTTFTVQTRTKRGHRTWTANSHRIGRMPPSQNRSADGTPSDSIGEDVNSQQPNVNEILDQMLAHPQTDPGVQIDHIEFFVGNFGESLNEVQTRAINEEYTRCLREQDFRFLDFRFSLFNFYLRRDARRPDPTRHHPAVLTSLRRDCKT